MIWKTSAPKKRGFEESRLGKNSPLVWLIAPCLRWRVEEYLTSRFGSLNKERTLCHAGLLSFLCRDILVLVRITNWNLLFGRKV